jgi:hypothetical protein
MSAPRLVIVNGLPGAGKSQVAARIAVAGQVLRAGGAGHGDGFPDLPGARIVHDTAGDADEAWARLVPDLEPLLKTAGERA